MLRLHSVTLRPGGSAPAGGGAPCTRRSCRWTSARCISKPSSTMLMNYEWDELQQQNTECIGYKKNNVHAAAHTRRCTSCFTDG